MSLLLRLLTARVATAFRPRPLASAMTSDVTTPMSLRLPPEVRGELQRMADEMDLSLHQTVVMGLRAFTEMDPLTLQVGLMRERVRQLARTYRLDVMAIQRLVPALTPDTLANDDLLARALTPDLIDHLSELFAVSTRWLEGKADSAAQHSWYAEPGDPVSWVKRYGPGRIRVYWHAARNAPWLTEPAPTSPDPDESDETNYARHLGLIMEIDLAQGPLRRLVHHWTDEKMDYHKSRTLARIIATRLQELGVQQVGMYVRPEQYQGLQNGALLPADVLRDRTFGSWSVADVLLFGQGLYQHEDKYADEDYTWAGVQEVQALKVKPLHR